MMSVLEYVLDGLEKALEVERELGVRSVEFDRALLKGGEEGLGRRSRSTKEENSTVDLQPRPRPFTSVSPSSELKQSNNSNNQTILPLVFVHDRPLSEKGVEMMAKILTAMGRTSENTPIIVAPPLPKAKIVVVLGGLALKKYFPGMRGEPGQWQKTPEGADVLITYSPEYILRFATVTPVVQKIKQDMWRSLKAVVQRLG